MNAIKYLDIILQQYLQSSSKYYNKNQKIATF